LVIYYLFIYDGDDGGNGESDGGSDDDNDGYDGNGEGGSDDGSDDGDDDDAMMVAQIHVYNYIYDNERTCTCEVLLLSFKVHVLLFSRGTMKRQVIEFIQAKSDHIQQSASTLANKQARWVLWRFFFSLVKHNGVSQY